MSTAGRWPAARLIGWLFAALLASGCAPTHFTVNVTSPPGANQGRPLYMVVRAVDSKQYMVETYADVAAKVVNPDDMVLQTTVVYPGTVKRVRVKMPPEMPVAISFLFTTPDGAWQQLLDVPVPERIDLELQENRIRTESTSTSKPFQPPDKMPAAPKAPKVPEAPKAPEAPKMPELGGKK
ncbi:MAG TPA: hypothetical protein VF815_20725 [Myxococcaceae bacterium]